MFNISAKNVDIKMLLISMQFTALSLHVSCISQIFVIHDPEQYLVGLKSWLSAMKTKLK